MAGSTHPHGFAPALVASVLDDALARRSDRPGPPVLGISALQGTGKSTLAAQLVALAAARGLHAVALSLDDLYLDRDDRARLAREVHPLLATRGPPGTHDVALGLEVLGALRERRTVALPRFDKGHDRRVAHAAWPAVGGCDLVVFEGWCLGTPAEDPAALATPLNALERDDDRDGHWRRHCNTALARDYPPLWATTDHMLHLAPPSFDVVAGWRWQQECARDDDGPKMTRAQVERFVQHFERVSRQALRTLPAIADRGIALDAGRRPRSA